MKKEIFRKKSLERISSPEKIDSYVKTVNVSSNLVLIAAATVIFGAVIWGAFGKVEVSVPAVTVCLQDETLCYVREADCASISKETEFVTVGGALNLTAISETPTRVSDTLSPYEAHVAGFLNDEWVCKVTLDSSLPQGVYKTQVLVKRVSPLSLLMN